jgi:hypothetical protein
MPCEFQCGFQCCQLGEQWEQETAKLHLFWRMAPDGGRCGSVTWLFLNDGRCSLRHYPRLYTCVRGGGLSNVFGVLGILSTAVWHNFFPSSPSNCTFLLISVDWWGRSWVVAWQEFCANKMQLVCLLQRRLDDHGDICLISANKRSTFVQVLDDVTVRLISTNFF